MKLMTFDVEIRLVSRISNVKNARKARERACMVLASSGVTDAEVLSVTRVEPAQCKRCGILADGAHQCIPRES